MVKTSQLGFLRCFDITGSRLEEVSSNVAPLYLACGSAREILGEVETSRTLERCQTRMAVLEDRLLICVAASFQHDGCLHFFSVLLAWHAEAHRLTYVWMREQRGVDLQGSSHGDHQQA